MKKCFAIVLTILLLLASVSTTSADGIDVEENIILDRYIWLFKAYATLSITNGTANCTGVAKAKSSNYSLSLTLSLQKKSGTSWNYVASWIGTGSGINGVVLNRTKSGLTSGTYRCVAYVQVYDSNGAYVESTTVYSQTCTI